MFKLGSKILKFCQQNYVYKHFVFLFRSFSTTNWETLDQLIVFSWTQEDYKFNKYEATKANIMSLFKISTTDTKGGHKNEFILDKKSYRNEV